jgi:hypothetical protein
MHTYKFIYIYMHKYKFIYMYAYILCIKRFVVIFVVIVWKITLNTFEKLERDYLRRLFEENHLRNLIWEESFEKRQREEIFDKEKQDRILKELRYQTWTNRQVLLIEILSIRVVYLNISSRFFLSNISFSLLSLKWSFSNDSLRIILANNLFQDFQTYST